MRQYLRKVRATFAGSGGGLVINPGPLQVHELKIGFNIQKDISGVPNSAVIEITNLSEGHRNAVGKELDDVTLEAGYMPPEGGSNVGIIFRGQMRDVEHRREGPDIITTLTCGDGDQAIGRATISRTFPRGTKVESVIEAINDEFAKQNIARGEWKGVGDLPTLTRPYSMCGSCSRELNRLGRTHGFYWSIQNGALEIIPGDGYLGGIAFLTPTTGLIESPTITDNGVSAKALLNPEIRPNRRVRIESEMLKANGGGGEYRVSTASYVGDNRDGDFFVQIDGESVSDAKVDEGRR